MKKFRLDIRSLVKSVIGLAIVIAYLYWVNQGIISDQDDTFGLAGLFVLISFATAYFPLPANIIVLGAVKSNPAWVVAVVAGFATLIAYFCEYLIFTILFKFNKIANIKNTWIYEKTAPLFDKYRFSILAFASFLPIPSEPLRIYAITQKYSRFLYVLSGFVGRIPRYFLLGYYGKAYVNSIWFIAGVFIFPAILLLIIKGVVALVAVIRRRTALEPVEQEAVSGGGLE